VLSNPLNDRHSFRTEDHAGSARKEKRLFSISREKKERDASPFGARLAG
jgi:hypothetical protein